MEFIIRIAVPDGHPWANPETRPTELLITDGGFFPAGEVTILADVEGDGVYFGEATDLP